MNRKIKLIWDFRGPDAEKTAQHHAIHLSDFVKKESLELNITGHTEISTVHAIAYMVVEEVKMLQIRDALLPHRAEVYSAVT